MFDVKKIRNDFPLLKNIKEIQGNLFVYFDNAATSLKPKCVIKACNKYYEYENANSHRGDYDLAYRVDKTIDEARNNIANFINANQNEIIFTSGCTMSLNMVAFSYVKKYLRKDDEIIISLEEHASNVLPWFELKRNIGINITYVDINEKGRITLDNLKKVITNKTKFISLAYISNVLGYELDIKQIIEYAHKNNILVCIDAAQAVPHKKIDVKDLDCDFLCFSGHKMCGPTGIGILYGKYELLQKMDPFIVGGGNNISFYKNGVVDYLNSPEKFESGTLNIEGIYGLNAAVKYLEKIGLNNIETYEKQLKNYAIKKLKENKNIIIYNEDAESSIITLNYKGVFAQDEGTYLNSKGICVRSGLHCAKLLNEYLKTDATVRISFYFYNTFEEVDLLIKALENGGNYLDAYFK